MVEFWQRSRMRIVQTPLFLRFSLGKANWGHRRDDRALAFFCTWKGLILVLYHRYKKINRGYCPQLRRTSSGVNLHMYDPVLCYTDYIHCSPSNLSLF